MCILCIPSIELPVESHYENWTGKRYLACFQFMGIDSLYVNDRNWCFMTLSPNTLIFLVEKMREAFAMQKLLTFFQPKIMEYFRY